jgi:hypothetical protein
MYYPFMPKSIHVVPKKRGRGRPATGRDPVSAIRLSAELKARIDEWAARHDDKPQRSEAIRRMIELVLGSRPALPKAKAEPAADQIDLPAGIRWRVEGIARLDGVSFSEALRGLLERAFQQIGYSEDDARRGAVPKHYANLPRWPKNKVIRTGKQPGGAIDLDKLAVVSKRGRGK